MAKYKIEIEFDDITESQLNVIKDILYGNSDMTIQDVMYKPRYDIKVYDEKGNRVE